jgi:hypothetical protein
VVVVDEDGFDLALPRSSPDTVFAVVVVDEDDSDFVLPRLSPDIAFAMIVVDEDGFNLVLVLRGSGEALAGSDDSSWVLEASDEASEVRAEVEPED